MDDYMFDGGGILIGRVGFRQIATGDLETVEEQACAFGIDGAAGDALEDLSNGSLNSGAVLG